MPVTFGSVGDIIAVALLIKDLVEALDKSRGSEAEYRQLVQDLRSLEEVLRRVDHLCNNSSTAGLSFELGALHQTALQITGSCRELVQGFATRLKKYDAALGENSNGKRNVLKSAVAKIRWQVGEKEDVAQFRTQIAAQAASLNLLLGTTTWSVGKDTQQMLGRMESKTSFHFNAQTAALSSISNVLTETKTLVKQTQNVSGSIYSSLSKLGELYAQVKSALNRIVLVNLATYRMVVAIHNRLPSYLERTLVNEPFILEDAVGRISPVHLQFISSWAAFEAVIETRFRGLQGYDKVVNGHWMLQDRVTGCEISRKRCWEGAFLPGQKIDMSLLFRRETTTETFDTTSSVSDAQAHRTSCPRCQADVPSASDADAMCDVCGLVFRRVTEIYDVEPTPSPPQPKPWFNKPAFGMVSLKVPFGPAVAAAKRRRETVDGIDVSGFKRIRILSKETRVRRHVFATRPSTASQRSMSHMPLSQSMTVLERASPDPSTSGKPKRSMSTKDGNSGTSFNEVPWPGCLHKHDGPSIQGSSVDRHLSYLPRSLHSRWSRFS